MWIDNPYTREELIATDGEHAVLGASGHARWSRCPGSVILLHGRPPSTSSYAELGTAAHELAQHCLDHETDASRYIDETFNDHVVDKEMADAVQIYLDFCRSLEPDYEQIEARVEYSGFVPGGFGTSDYMGIRDTTLTTVDYKHGMGVRVSPEHNGQLLLYALGLYQQEKLLWNIESICLVICQPRLDHIEAWNVTVDELMAFAGGVTKAADRVFEDKVELVPGETQCRFCGAADSCPAVFEEMGEHLTHHFDDLDAVGNKITPEQLATDILPHLQQWERQITLYREYARTLITGGETVGDWKLVKGNRGKRSWVDEEIALEAMKKLLGKRAFVTKFLSPTKILKELELKKGMDEYEVFCSTHTFQPDGSPVLAPGDDKREALQSYAEDFND